MPVIIIRMRKFLFCCKHFFVLCPLYICVLVILYLILGYRLPLYAANPNPTNPPSLHLGTFLPLTPIPSPSINVTISPFPATTHTPITPRSLITGGPVSSDSPYYCIDDEDPEGCDDNTAFHVPKGIGGSAGTCGTVIEEAHKLVASLPQGLKDFRDSLNPSVVNCNYATGIYSGGYISTFFVIDAYNLSGFKELSKVDPSHITGTDMRTWWQSQQALDRGYKYLPYSPAVIEQYASGKEDLTGCVMFLELASGGVHVGLVNALEIVNQHGDGVISILQSGARYFIDRFEVVGWNITNTPLHQIQLNSVSGFGCHI